MTAAVKVICDGTKVMGRVFDPIYRSEESARERQDKSFLRMWRVCERRRCFWDDGWAGDESR